MVTGHRAFNVSSRRLKGGEDVEATRSLGDRNWFPELPFEAEAGVLPCEGH